jgi:tetratricopeptide (TPR) repeat protein
MIVRDNETTIGPALESIRPWVDEIIVVDTGSNDQTPAICRHFGAKLYDFPWCDDFAAARNESLKHARGEWIFWMDSDDTITPACGQKLRNLVDGEHRDEILGYVMQVQCPFPGEYSEVDVTEVDHVKLIRNRPDIRFDGRIHEQLLPSIRRAGGDVAWTEIFVRHSGNDHSPEARQKKLDRDLRILQLESKANPDHPFVLFNLGMTYADAKQYTEAVAALDRCLAVSTPDESHLRKAYSLLVSTLSQARHEDAAWLRCQQGLQLYPDDKELLFRAGLLHHHFGRLNDAAETYLRVLNEPAQRCFRSMVQGLDSFKARHNLALVYQDLGRLDLAEEQWRCISAASPRYLPAWRALSEIWLGQERFAEVEELCARLASAELGLQRESQMIAAKLAARRGQLAVTCSLLQQADAACPDDLEPLRILCRILFDQGDPEVAELALKELCERDPTDPSAHHNLGLIFLRRNNTDAAVRALSRSLELRPDSPETRRQLQFALQA